MTSDDKYKLFRNYMCNELHITRDDIQRWTKEAVAAEVQKQLGQINIDQICKDTIKATVNFALDIRGYNAGQQLREAVAKELAKTMSLSMQVKEAEPA